MALSSLTSALLTLTLLLYFVLLLLAQRELARRPYCTYRTNNILLRLQYQTRLIAAVFFVLCNTLFWWGCRAGGGSSRCNLQAALDGRKAGIRHAWTCRCSEVVHCFAAPPPPPPPPPPLQVHRHAQLLELH